MEVNIGDKLWIYCGPVALMVGHLLEVSPDGKFIGISPVPYEDYHKLTLSERAKLPMNWCPLAACSYVSHITREDLKKQDEEIEKQFKGGGFFQQPR